MDTNSQTNNKAADSAPFVLPQEFKIRLRMKSDWHVGTGAGRPGSVDKLLARDAEGFPFVPAKTLNGIWRDALERLTLGLENGAKDGAWQKWVDAIFGNQPAQLSAREVQSLAGRGKLKVRPSVLITQPARLSANLRAVINQALRAIPDEDERKRQKRKLLSAMTFIKPGVAIDARSGTAVMDYLRFEEMGRSDTVMEAGCELNFALNFDAEQKQIASALLLLSANMVERLGGKRRRGAGCCELTIVDYDDALIQQAVSCLQILEDQKDNVPSFNKSDESFSLSRAAKVDNEWQQVEFSLCLLTPVSIVTATLGNVSKSLDFIPGTYLLPHFTKVLKGNLDADFFQAVAYGDLQVLPATIQINKQRGLPVPRVLSHEKVGGSFKAPRTIYNKLKDDLTKAKQPKPFRDGYVQTLAPLKDEKGDNQLPAYELKPKTLLIHNTVQDEVQRPTTEVGGVFSREAIPAGTILRGILRLKKSIADQLGTGWEKTLEGHIRLGTSRKDDYGLADLSLVRNDKDENDKDGVARLKPFTSKARLNEREPKELTVYFESDVLLRDKNLRQTNSAEDLAEALSQKLNEGLPDVSQMISLECKESLIQTRRIESWHESWGFPRPTLLAMAAGSCVVFEIKDFASFDQAKKDKIEGALQTLKASGIGERRGEGYGQIRFNPPLLVQPVNGWTAAVKPSDENGVPDKPNGKLNEADQAFAKLIETTAWREALHLAVLKVADNKQSRQDIFGFDSNDEQPPMSQIGGLRSAFGRLQRVGDKTIVTNWLEHLRDTKNRRERWAKDEKTAKEKLNGIINLVNNEKKVWVKLGNTWNAPPTLGRSAAELREELWAEAMRALFDACARAHKRTIENQQQEEN